MFPPHVSSTSSPLRALQGHGGGTDGSGEGEGLAAPQPALPAGAGQDVGRSCILVSIAGKNVMLDCGMHMGFNDDVSSRRCLWGWGGPIPRNPALRVSGSDPWIGDSLGSWVVVGTDESVSLHCWVAPPPSRDGGVPCTGGSLYTEGVCGLLQGWGWARRTPGWASGWVTGSVCSGRL